jgi:nucleoside-diphosphate-sugar epimerase
LSNQIITITETYRDYIDPQSFINALKIMVENNFKSPLFVIGTGVELSTKDILTQVSLCLGVDLNQLKVETINSKPSDPKKITLNSSLFQELTQWKPEFELSNQIQQIIKNFNDEETNIRQHH